MDKRRSKAARPDGSGAAHKVSSILGEIPVPNRKGAIPADDVPADVDDDFADLRDIDFSQYIAGDDDNAGSMNSPSSPSVGMMSKTPFKTPVPSEYADDPIELDSSPAGRPIKLRDYLPGLGSSVEPSFAMDDSQQTKVIAKTVTVNKAPHSPPPQISYSLSVSPDNAADAPRNTEAGQLADIRPGSSVAEVPAPAKPKKASQGQKVEPPKKSARNRKVNGKKRPEKKHDDKPAAGSAKEAAPPKEIELSKTSAKEGTPAEVTSSKRPLLARMLSVLSEPGSLKWEEPLVGGRQSPVGSDECFPAHSPSSPDGTPAVQEDTTMQPVDNDGSIYEPSIPASFAEPFELSDSLGPERAHEPPPAVPKKNQVSPTLRLDPDIMDPSPPRGSPSKSPVKGARKRPLPEKRGQATQKAPAPLKRRRGQEPVKKRVVRPRAKAKTKSANTCEDIDDALVIPATGTREPETTAIGDSPHMNTKTQVSETGSPKKINVPSESASPGDSGINEMTNSPDLSENQEAVLSPNRDASRTKAPGLEAVFQPQPSRPRAERDRIDSTQLREKRVVVKGPKPSSGGLVTPKSLSKPSGAGPKQSTEKHAPTGASSHTQPVAPVQKPDFEAFRRHILGQLTTIEARQQHYQPSESGSPEGPGATPDGRAPMNIDIEPQHMLGQVLHTITEKTLEYVKAKEKDLDSIAQEYQSGVTAFIERVEKLHEVEHRGTIKALNKERQSFIESCEDGVKTCEGYMAKLEQCLPSARSPGGLEKWLEQGQAMKEGLQEAELAKS